MLLGEVVMQMQSKHGLYAPKLLKLFTGIIKDKARLPSKAFIRVSSMPWYKQKLK